MKQLLIFLFVASMAVSCKGKGSKHWAQKDKDAFNSNCVNGAKASMGDDKAKAYCSCMLDKIEVKYPNAEDAGKLDMNSMTEMAKDCLK